MKFLRTLLRGTVYLQASLKAFELDSRIMEEKYGLKVRQIDYDNDADLETWMSIIHTSYDDCHFTVDRARKYLASHLFMNNTKTFLFQEVVGGGARWLQCQSVYTRPTPRLVGTSELV